MINQTEITHCNCDAHVNGFVDLNGVPYLLGEYLDKRTFQQVDRSVIKSEINVDLSEAMRAVIDINVDDIGKRASDGYPSIVGNNSKYQNLLNMLHDYGSRFNNQLDVLRKGIVIRVNYQLENLRTGQVIRTMSEDYRIRDRKYFLDINPRDINDNAVIVNFSDAMVSTINQFTHGLERMMFRITNVQMFYEVVKRDVCTPTIQSFGGCRPGPLPTMYGTEENMYSYHQKMQSRHYIGYPDSCRCDCGPGPGDILPPNWVAFNKFYHFDDNGSNIYLHQQEIDDPRYKTILLSAGTVMVNRTFAINPGHRIIFKFCIWKNDVTVVNDTIDVAQALKVPVFRRPYGKPYDDNCDCHPFPGPPFGHDHINPDYETLIRMYKDMQCINDRQNGMLNYLMTQVNQLTETVTSLLPPVVDDVPGNDVTTPDEGSTGDNTNTGTDTGNGSDESTTPNEGDSGTTTTPPTTEENGEDTSGTDETVTGNEVSNPSEVTGEATE